MALGRKTHCARFFPSFFPIFFFFILDEFPLFVRAAACVPAAGARRIGDGNCGAGAVQGWRAATVATEDNNAAARRAREDFSRLS